MVCLPAWVCFIMTKTYVMCPNQQEHSIRLRAANGGNSSHDADKLQTCRPVPVTHVLKPIPGQRNLREAEAKPGDVRPAGPRAAWPTARPWLGKGQHAVRQHGRGFEACSPLSLRWPLATRQEGWKTAIQAESHGCSRNQNQHVMTCGEKEQHRQPATKGAQVLHAVD